jgi:hypothetical protein
MFKTYQYATNDEKVIASLKYIVSVKGAHGNLQKKSYGQKIGKRKARMGKSMWWKGVVALEIQDPNENQICY